MSGSLRSRIRVTRLLDGAVARKALEQEIAAGLTSEPKSIPSKYFYDERGSRLFEEITRQPEYYLTRAETEILERRAGEIAAAAGPEELVELGSGFSRKTKLLLTAMHEAGTGRYYLPLDVSEEALVEAAERLVRELPWLVVHGVVGDFMRHLTVLPRDGRQLLCFLGSTIGNLRPDERRRFYEALASRMTAEDRLLVGYDLLKDEARLEAAYNDAAGVTVRFNRNILHVLNAELDGDFDPESFDHVSRFDRDRCWIESSLRARREMTVHLRRIGLEVRIAQGEEIKTEISAKFDEDSIRGELERAGLEAAEHWTDEGRRFALVLARRGRQGGEEGNG